MTGRAARKSVGLAEAAYPCMAGFFKPSLEGVPAIAIIPRLRDLRSVFGARNFRILEDS